jgi:hypothetical protein
MMHSKFITKQKDGTYLIDYSVVGNYGWQGVHSKEDALDIGTKWIQEEIHETSKTLDLLCKIQREITEETP